MERLIIISRLISKYNELLHALKKQSMEENRQKFYDVALSFLGKDVTPRDEIPDEVACAITINTIHTKAFGYPIGGGASTYLLYRALLNSPFFVKIDLPEQGAVVISPTGYRSKKTKIENGHVGCVGENGIIMSNDSKSGLFLENYTLVSWRKRFVVEGSYPMYFFRRI